MGGIERGDAPAVLYGDVPAALNRDASRACFMGRACAPLERTPLLKFLKFPNFPNLPNFPNFPNLPNSLPTHLHTLICCQSGADVTLTRKSHRWVVLDVRSIGGVD